jgi:hypothetical protein
MINHLLQIIAVAAIVYWIQNILSLIILHLLQQLVWYFIIQLIKNPLLILLLLLLLLKLVSCVNINLGITGNSPTPTLNQFVDIILLWLSLIVKSSDLYIVLNHVAALR